MNSHVAATKCENSLAFGIVADRKTNRAADGSRMVHSSQIIYIQVYI